MFIQIPCRTSECVEVMYVNLLRGVVQVAFAKGSVYEYDCVSRRAILNLLMNPNMSLGFGLTRTYFLSIVRLVCLALAHHCVC